MSQEVSIPSVRHLLVPTLDAIRQSDSATIDEIVERVLARQQYSEEQQAVLHGDGPRTEIEYRLAWARTHLKGMGLLDNSARGIWSITERGRVASANEVFQWLAEYKSRPREARRARRLQDIDDEPEASDEEAWKERLLDVLVALDPSDFERLAGRLLREAGFISVTVTGRSGDGGIDGVGVYRLSLLSFPVFFQCKRYAGSVRAHAVRDFRGAMAGRGDKGLLITTGTFTREAQEEATRDGAPPIDLIDGERLCDLLKEFGMGVKTRTRVSEEVSIRSEFFSSL